ncbi:MAG: rRNA pseudouridine synthase [Candidatus Cloacimonetes bacterium]|nr:rRNA pseudouridine synthase [Candidatus Cloacimonadota bacterium]
MVRINKYLAQCNLGSRRKVEEFIKEGKITLNGKIVKDLSVKIDPKNDIIEYDKKKIEFNFEKMYLMLNKPKKYITTKFDEFSRNTVYQLLPDFDQNIFSVGRLDYMSEGLLIFTNDGDFANKIIHPRNKFPKVYKVIIKGSLSIEKINQLRSGIMIDGIKTRPAIVHKKKSDSNTSTFRITIYEGRKRQIRYMIKSVGSEVLELKRLQIGNIKLGKLPLGMWRMLKPSEIESFNNKRKI